MAQIANGVRTDYVQDVGVPPAYSANAIAQGLSTWRSHNEALARQLSQGLRSPCGLGAQLSSLRSLAPARDCTQTYTASC